MSIISSDDIADLGTILFIGAHPDDETFCAGSLLTAAVQNGQTVACVTATRGEGGIQDEARWPAATLAQTRQQELEEALKVLGIVNHHWLDYPDGGCANADASKAANEIAAFISQYQPDTIMTFGADGLTGHPDHVTVSKWTDRAITLSGASSTVYNAVITKEQYDSHLKEADTKLNLFFNIEQPPILPSTGCDIVFVASDNLARLKQTAFAVMPSQYDAMIAAFDKDFLTEAFRTEAFVKARS